MRVSSVYPEMNLKIKIPLPSIFFSAVYNDCTRRFNYFKGNERVYLARVYTRLAKHMRVTVEVEYRTAGTLIKKKTVWIISSGF